MASLERIVVKLLSVEEIMAGLDTEFAPLEPMLTGFRIVEKSTPKSAIESVEKILSTKFPGDFRNLISKFDFGNLTIGPIVFSASGDYLAEIIELNSSVMWWRERQRPADLIMVGNSDPVAILMDTSSGSIYALDPEIGWEKSKKIANSFLNFFCAVGTVVLARNHTVDRCEMAAEIQTLVGGEDISFWHRLAS